MIPDPIPSNPNAYFNGFRHGTLVAPAIRLRAAELGLNVTVANSTNVSVTGQHYTAPDSDVLLKSLKVYNNYNKRFGIPAPGYTGEIREDRPEVMNGGTYARSFKLPAYTADATTTLDGRMIVIGNWGGRGTLHGYNERVELDGMVDFVKRCARVFAEYAGGVPHKWEVSGNGNTALPHKKRLAYAVSNDAVAGIYIQEETTANLAIMDLYSKNVLSRDETTEILFARKFRMNGLTGATPALTLTTTLTNANGTNKGSGKVYVLVKNVSNNNWVMAGSGTNGTAACTFAANSSFDQTAATGATSRDVEVNVIALVVTNGNSVPFDISGEGNVDTDSTIREHVKDQIKKESGCNAGFAIFALAFIPFVVRRRK
jgi:Synergist-CTERM protein sorting domain-containing protein